jgi:hypothetical protein
LLIDIRFLLNNWASSLQIRDWLLHNFPKFNVYRNNRIIDKRGRIKLFGKSVSQTEFKKYVHELMTLYGTDLSFIIFADENAEYHDIQPVLRLLKDEGAVRIWMAVQDEDHNRWSIGVDISDMDPIKSPFVITVE